MQHSLAEHVRSWSNAKDEAEREKKELEKAARGLCAKLDKQDVELAEKNKKIVDFEARLAAAQVRDTKRKEKENEYLAKIESLQDEQQANWRIYKFRTEAKWQAWLAAGGKSVAEAPRLLGLQGEFHLKKELFRRWLTSTSGGPSPGAAGGRTTTTNPYV